MKFDLITMKEYEAVTAERALNAGKEKPNIQHIIDIEERESHGGYEDVKQALFPYITTDPDFSSRVKATEDAFPQFFRSGEFPIRTWNGFQVACMLDWKLIHPDMGKTMLVYQEDMDKYGITEDEMFDQAMANLKTWADEITHTLVNMGKSCFLYTGENLPLNGCSIMLLDDLWRDIYVAVEEPYYVFPMLRERILIVPARLSRMDQIHDDHDYCLSELEEGAEVLSDAILYYDPAKDELTVLPDRVTN